MRKQSGEGRGSSISAFLPVGMESQGERQECSLPSAALMPFLQQQNAAVPGEVESRYERLSLGLLEGVMRQDPCPARRHHHSPRIGAGRVGRHPAGVELPQIDVALLPFRPLHLSARRAEV